MLNVYNDLTHKKEALNSLSPKKIKMYVCGPTVYDECHIGHARSFIMFDIMRRYLEHLGYDVTLVMNFTDVDDKMINRAREEVTTIFKLADRFITRFFEDMDALNMKRATIYPRATECIPEMTDFIQAILDKGHAYVSDGNVYFDVRSYKNYGNLSGKNLEDGLSSKTKIPEGKRHVEDFALWKQKKGDEPSWKSPWGEGRPGWHIECSVMSKKYLGETIDIHGGGQDLIFPHHENEIAQSEAAHGKKFVNYWIHNGFVNINKEKMSKSLGNFLTIREVLDKYPPMVIRLFLLSAHYRKPLNYEPENITPFRVILNRYLNALELSAQIKEGTQKILKDNRDFETFLMDAEKKFYGAMNDDFNTPVALAVLQSVAKEINQYSTTTEIPPISLFRKAHALLTTFGGILGIKTQALDKGSLMEQLLEILLDIRNELRKSKNFKLADEIRVRLEAVGIVIEDFAGQTKWRKV